MLNPNGAWNASCMMKHSGHFLSGQPLQQRHAKRRLQSTGLPFTAGRRGFPTFLRRRPSSGCVLASKPAALSSKSDLHRPRRSSFAGTLSPAFFFRLPDSSFLLYPVATLRRAHFTID